MSSILGASVMFRKEIDDGLLLRLIEQRLTLLSVVGAEMHDGATLGLIPRRDSLDARERLLCSDQVTSFGAGLEIIGLDSLARGLPSFRVDFICQIRLQTSCPDTADWMCYRFKTRDWGWIPALDASIVRTASGISLNLDLPNAVWHSAFLPPLLKDYFKQNVRSILEMLAGFCHADPAHYDSTIFEAGPNREEPLATWLYETASIIPKLRYHG